MYPQLRNIVTAIPQRYQKECMQDVKLIYLAANYRAAVQRYKAWCQKWRRKVPKAVACLEQDIEDMLLFFDHDRKLWARLRTTNVIERFFKELRKRTRPMSLFANTESCNRILYALFAKYNKKWEDHRYAIF